MSKNEGFKQVYNKSSNIYKPHVKRIFTKIKSFYTKLTLYTKLLLLQFQSSLKLIPSLQSSLHVGTVVSVIVDWIGRCGGAGVIWSG